MKSFFTLQEIAARYSVVPVTIRRWLAAGKFVRPVKHPNGRRFFSTEEVLAWEDQHRAA